MTIYIHPVYICYIITFNMKEVPHTLPIFSRSRVIVDHHMSICQTGRPVACAQCALRTAVLACAHGASVRRTAVLACAQCASRTEAPSNGLRKYHRRERHDPQSRGLLKFNNRWFHFETGRHFYFAINFLLTNDLSGSTMLLSQY